MSIDAMRTTAALPYSRRLSAHAGNVSNCRIQREAESGRLVTVTVSRSSGSASISSSKMP